MTSVFSEQINLCLEQCLSLTGELANLLGLEQQALEQQQFNELPAIANQKQRLLSELEQQQLELEQQCLKQHQEPKIWLNEQGSQLPDWPALKLMLEQVRQMNEQNDLLLQRQLLRVQHLLNLLKPQEKTYGKSAKLLANSPGHRLGQA